MATGINLSVSLRGLKEFKDKLAGVARGMGNRGELHRRFGIEGMKWVDRNFQSEGGMLSTGRWKKLSPNTILGRRQKSSRILQDTGRLRQSFVMSFDAREARIGSPMKIAAYHHKGGTKSYPIRPKNKMFLAFPHASGTPLRRSVKFPSIERTLPKGTPIAYSKGVTHPPLPQRRLLPRTDEIMPTLIKVTIGFLKQLQEKGGAP